VDPGVEVDGKLLLEVLTLVEVVVDEDVGGT